MKLYILKYRNEVIGYTYDLCAVKALALFIRTNSESDRLLVATREISGDVMLHSMTIKTKSHLENLSRYYHRLGYQFYSWKLIQFNRTVLPKVEYSFYSRFEELYQFVLIEELNAELDEHLR